MPGSQRVSASLDGDDHCADRIGSHCESAHGNDANKSQRIVLEREDGLEKLCNLHDVLVVIKVEM